MFDKNRDEALHKEESYKEEMTQLEIDHARL